MSGYTAEQVFENKREYREAVEARADRWVAACGGLEEPTRHRNGRSYLYVFNPGQMGHGWLDMETDIVYLICPYA
ncbi:MAG: hypothetical protein GY769_17640 [bacterium]|nr:hypothetical protein [bacterium]